MGHDSPSCGRDRGATEAGHGCTRSRGRVQQGAARWRPDRRTGTGPLDGIRIIDTTYGKITIEEFIRRYGDSIYGTLARARLEELKKQVDEARPVANAAAAQPPGAHETEPQRVPTIDPAQLARALKAELKRVGCDPGLPDAERAPRPGWRWKNSTNMPEPAWIPAVRTRIHPRRGRPLRAAEEAVKSGHAERPASSASGSHVLRAAGGAKVLRLQEPTVL